MKRALVYTITRASSPERGRLLLDTITMGQDQAGMAFDWHIYSNADLASELCEGARKTGLIAGYEHSPINVGQHIPTNKALSRALEGDYDYLVRVDDDVEWLTKRWLAKMIECSSAEGLDNRVIVAPHVKGLKYPVPVSKETFYRGGFPCKLAVEAVGGICRLHPVQLLREFPYHADTRQPLGFGDATGIARWAQTNMIPMVVTSAIRIKHAQTTRGQENEDPAHFSTHTLFQRCPFIPPWRPDEDLAA